MAPDGTEGERTGQRHAVNAAGDTLLRVNSEKEIELPGDG
jgi:hypothetical protein